MCSHLMTRNKCLLKSKFLRISNSLPPLKASMAENPAICASLQVKTDVESVQTHIVSIFAFRFRARALCQHAAGSAKMLDQPYCFSNR